MSILPFECHTIIFHILYIHIFYIYANKIQILLVSVHHVRILFSSQIYKYIHIFYSAAATFVAVVHTEEDFGDYTSRG